MSGNQQLLSIICVVAVAGIVAIAWVEAWGKRGGRNDPQ